MQNITFNVEGMMCKNCQAKVEKAIEATDGVKSFTVDHNENSAVVSYDDNVTNSNTIADAITNSGFPAKAI